MSWAELGDWLARNALALYAAALSTVLALGQFYSSRPRMTVALVPGVSKNSDDSGLYVAIRNPSAHTIHIGAITLLYQYRKAQWWEPIWNTVRLRWHGAGWIHDGSVFEKLEIGLPISIPAHSSHLIFVAQDRIQRILATATGTKLVVCVQDALWRNKYSKPFDAHYFR